MTKELHIPPLLPHTVVGRSMVTRKVVICSRRRRRTASGRIANVQHVTVHLLHRVFCVQRVTLLRRAAALLLAVAPKQRHKATSISPTTFYTHTTPQRLPAQTFPHTDTTGTLHTYTDMHTHTSRRTHQQQVAAPLLHLTDVFERRHRPQRVANDNLDRAHGASSQ